VHIAVPFQVHGLSLPKSGGGDELETKSYWSASARERLTEQQYVLTPLLQAHLQIPHLTLLVHVRSPLLAANHIAPRAIRSQAHLNLSVSATKLRLHHTSQPIMPYTTQPSMATSGRKHVGGGTKPLGNIFELLNQAPGTNPTSPTTDSSDETLHEDGSSEIRSTGDAPTFSSPLSGEATSFSSPLGADSLNFNNLTLDDAGPRMPRGRVGRYNGPSQRGNLNFNDPNRFGSVRQGGGPFNGRGGGAVAHRGSRIWMSSEAAVMQEFMLTRNNLRRQFKNSDVAKWKVADYIAHRESMLACETDKLADQVKIKEDAFLFSIPPMSEETQQNLWKWGLLGNFNQIGNFSRVLGEQTIWCQDWTNGKEDFAPWPSIAELKWEGEDRAKTGVGRFFPLPREEGPAGICWNQLPVVDQYPMDQVARIPTMEDVYLPVDDQIEPEMEYLWSKNLEKEIDIFLGS
jgi:hypothetical protein